VFRVGCHVHRRLRHPAGLRRLPRRRDHRDAGARCGAGGVRAQFLLERFYPNSPHDWLGVTFAGDDIAYGFRKEPDRHARWSGTAWKVYDAGRGGGSVRYQDVPPSHADLLHTARRAFDLPLVGFDVICHEGGPMVVDVNTGPALYPELFTAAGKSMAHELHRAYRTAIRRATERHSAFGQVTGGRLA
jgi:hypothetical protein